MSIRKIGIIGAGHVGSHGGYALISQGLAEEIVYIDIDEKKAAAQALDLQDSSTYLGRAVHVKAGTYDDIKDAGILIVAAGPLPDMAAGQTDRQQTLGATVAILKDIVPKIKASGFNGIITAFYLQVLRLIVQEYAAPSAKKQAMHKDQSKHTHLENTEKVSLFHGVQLQLQASLFLNS